MVAHTKLSLDLKAEMSVGQLNLAGRWNTESDSEMVEAPSDMIVLRLTAENEVHQNEEWVFVQLAVAMAHVQMWPVGTVFGCLMVLALPK